MSESSSPDTTRPARHSWWWVLSTYFAEGLPYSVVHYVANVLFTELKASLQLVGMTALFHLPWNLKFLWGPYVDEYGTKRGWLVATEIALAVALGLLALVTRSPYPLAAASAGFIAVAFLSATHDIAVDGYYLEALDTHEQSRYVGLRAMAYRAAMLLVAGPLLVVIAEIGWAWGFVVCMAPMAGLAVVHQRALPRVETSRQPMQRLLTPAAALRAAAISATLAGFIAVVRSTEGRAAIDTVRRRAPGAVAMLERLGWSGVIVLLLLTVLVVLVLMRRQLLDRVTASDSFYARAFASFLAQPYVERILLFVVAFRAGESHLISMRYPFFDSVGMTLKQYGYANGTFGMAAALVGAWGGGYIISRQGLRGWIWPFVLAQNILNLLYAWLASSVDAGQPVSFELMAGVITLESFGAGLGTAVFMVYLMRCCDPAHRAAHMAILTALMSVSFTLSGVLSGFLAEALGFAGYFVFTFAIALPGMAIIPWLPNLDEPEPPASPA